MYLYIVMSENETLISRTLKLATHKKYCHVSISFDDNLEEMYSFGRRCMWFPLIGGFVVENRNRGFFAIRKETNCKVYRVNITNRQASITKERLVCFLKNSESYTYGFLNLIYILFDKKYRRYYRYICSTFCAYILRGIIDFKKDYSLIRPEDFEKLNLECIYEGKLAEFNKDNYYQEYYKLA